MRSQCHRQRKILTVWLNSRPVRRIELHTEVYLLTAREDYVFTGVYLSTGGGRVSLVLFRGRYGIQNDHNPWKDYLQEGLPSRRTTLRKTTPLWKGYSVEGLYPLDNGIGQAVGMHATGMLSCFNNVASFTYSR